MTARVLVRSENASGTARAPWLLPVCAGLLIAAGVMCVGGGSVRSENNTGIVSALLASLGPLGVRQLCYALVAGVVAWGVSRLPYRLCVRYAAPLYVASILGLLVVFFMPAVNGSRRWIPLGVVSVQPSEVAKLALILALAAWLRHRTSYRTLPGLALPLLLAALPAVLILKEPDLGTSLLFGPVLFAMLFAAGARPRHLIGCLLCAAAALPALWMVMSAEQKSRVVVLFTQPEVTDAPTGDGYQLWRSKRVIASGGAWGSEVVPAPLAEREAEALPAATTDFVYSLIGGRFGWWGCLLVLGTELTVAVGCLAVAARTRDPAGRLIPVGVGVLFGSQSLINAGMTVGLMPITGLTLPFVSYGGSSLVVSGALLGLVLSVARHPVWQPGDDPFRFGAADRM